MLNRFGGDREDEVGLGRSVNAKNCKCTSVLALIPIKHGFFLLFIACWFNYKTIINTTREKAKQEQVAHFSCVKFEQLDK